MSLFGQGASTGGGLFGQPQQQQQQGATQTGGGLFGQTQQQTTPAPSGGLFGSAQSTQQQPATGGLFGGQTQQKPSLFGASTTQQTTQSAPSTGGLFGQQSSQPAAATTGGLFGQQSSQPAAATGGLFGGGQQTSGLSGGLFGKPAAAPAQQQPGSSLFGGQPATTNTAPSLGLGLGQSTAAQGQSQAQPSQPSGAYFDSLFAKSKKDGAVDGSMEDLPSLQLGLNDLHQRLRKLGARPQDKPIDGRAHYLLAGSGVDPTTAARDLGSLDLQMGRVEKPSGYSSTEMDVETYLANLQSKTTLSMIADGLDRSARDFDSFLEDNVTQEWEAQRKRIYEHFGIKARDDGPGAGTPSRESQGGFGRSRRSKNPQAGARTGRQSVFGKSNLQRSVIGTPSKIGSHQSEFADVERATDSKGSFAGGHGSSDRSVREKQTKLAEKIRGLNSSRLIAHPYPILSELADVENKSLDPHSPHIVEAYHAVRQIVGEDPTADTTIDGATAKERQYAQMYLDDAPNSANAIGMRKKLLSGANTFLERQFLKEMEALISKYPHEANLGGRPDIVSKVKAYIRLRAARKDLVPDNTELQLIKGEYVWAIIFYLLRSGHVDDAAKYVNDQAPQLRTFDRTFQAYLNSYASSDDRRLKRSLQDRCNSEYIQRVRNAPENSIDPFRMACYKIIGRCDLNNRNLDGLNTDINDWIWLQFNLAREGDRSVEVASEAYGLSEVQSSIKEIGAKHFPKASSDDNSGSFGMFFYLQVLSGMFEEAIAYLYPFSYVDAVHFAIALDYYGLLRPSDPLTAGNDLRSLNSKDLVQINFGRMLGYYTRDFRAADVVSAVDYLALICLNMDMPGEAGRRNANLCWEALRELVLESREYSRLIGDIRPDGQRLRGVIEERGPLIGLDEESDFINTVTVQAASFAEENGRTTDAVLLYHLAGEYDTVVAIVSRALSEAISIDIGQDPLKLMPVKPRAAGDAAQPGSSLSLASIDDPVELARTMMSMYERDAMFHRKIQDQNKVACGVLLGMSTIKSLVEAGQWAQCLDKIRSLDILPLEAGGDPAIIRAYAAKFPGLSQPVAINVPNLLMWTILACTRQRDALSTGAFSGNEGTRRLIIDQMRQMVLDLTTYTSQLRYRLPPTLHEALARAAAE
ncbi:Nup93/Nic96-domain-containing protein [Plectosphaerella cucumerina]|uniref:Nup93/Nic96-domain-containing protein n=1 Tax=Plectosphaerella cucumerina TaxID=40658 RepID=A0A8K0X5V4_9PEZI|nr:Nup93/Nic96-domain-containing protein [Plectosphaerella cucumerina]